MNYRYIAIDGNIGVGKSTVSTLLAEHYNATLILEEFSDNKYLPLFYKEPEKYSLQLELSFLADRYKQLEKQLSNNNDSQLMIADYHFAKSRLFAKVNLSEDEFQLFDQYYHILSASLPKPDLLIYLKSDTEQLRKNIKKRGRSYEGNIENEYLIKVQNEYDRFLEEAEQKTLILDLTNIDLLTDTTRFNDLIDFLNQSQDFHKHNLVRT